MRAIKPIIAKDFFSPYRRHDTQNCWRTGRRYSQRPPCRFRGTPGI
jgi:hypothetical protein